jgi:hypothetical protein
MLELLKYVIRNNRRAFHAYTVTDPPTDRVNPWGRNILTTAMLGGRVFSFRWSCPVPTAAFLWEGNGTETVSLVLDHQPAAIRMWVYNFRPEPAPAGLRVLRLPEGRYRLAIAPDTDGDRRPDSDPHITEIELRRFSAAPLTIPARKVTLIELNLLQERPKIPRPDLAVTLAAPVTPTAPLTAYAHNLGSAAAEDVTVRLCGADGATLGETRVAAIPPLTGFEPQYQEIRLPLPVGIVTADAVLRIDPDNRIDEINESNNDYPLAQGVPPPVESSPPRP